MFHAVDLGEFILEFLGLGTHGQGVLRHGGQRRIAFRIIVDAAHEGIGNFQLHTVIGGIRTGDPAFGFPAGEMFLVNCFDRHNTNLLFG